MAILVITTIMVFTISSGTLFYYYDYCYHLLHLLHLLVISCYLVDYSQLMHHFDNYEY